MYSWLSGKSFIFELLWTVPWKEQTGDFFFFLLGFDFFIGVEPFFFVCFFFRKKYSETIFASSIKLKYVFLYLL